jgi:superfamily II DNA helicase RecQ
LIVSTSALGVGVDIPWVRFTLHVDQAWGMIDFVQETGRAREEAISVVLVSQQRQQRQRQQHRRESAAELATTAEEREDDDEGEEEEEEEEEEEIVDDRMAMAQFVYITGCRRAVMSKYMDGVATSCR